MARNITLGGALKSTAKALTNAGKVRPPKKAKAPKAEKVKAEKTEAPRPATSNLQSSFAMKMAGAVRKAAGKPIAALSASLAVPTAKVVEGGVSLQALAKMAHRPGVKGWGAEPSISAKALDEGKVQFTAYGVARYAEAFKAK